MYVHARSSFASVIKLELGWGVILQPMAGLCMRQWGKVGNALFRINWLPWMIQTRLRERKPSTCFYCMWSWASPFCWSKCLLYSKWVDWWRGKGTQIPGRKSDQIKQTSWKYGLRQIKFSPCRQSLLDYETHSWNVHLIKTLRSTTIFSLYSNTK